MWGSPPSSHKNRQPLTAVRAFPYHLKRGWIFSIVKETGSWCHILKGTAAPWGTCLFCLNSLRGLLLIWFMVTWLVIIYTPLRSYPVAMDGVTGLWMRELAQSDDELRILLIEEITALIESALNSKTNERYSVEFEQTACYYLCCLISVPLSIPLITLPLTGSDLICPATPSEYQFMEMYLISLTCGMVFLNRRALAQFSLQFMQVHCLMSSKSTSQLFIVMAITLSYTSRLVPRRTLTRLMQLLKNKRMYQCFCTFFVILLMDFTFFILRIRPPSTCIRWKQSMQTDPF